jgi:hypothetical protein
MKCILNGLIAILSLIAILFECILVSTIYMYLISSVTSWIVPDSYQDPVDYYFYIIIMIYELTTQIKCNSSKFGYNCVKWIPRSNLETFDLN